MPNADRRMAVYNLNGPQHCTAATSHFHHPIDIDRHCAWLAFSMQSRFTAIQKCMAIEQTRFECLLEVVGLCVTRYPSCGSYLS